MAAASYTLRTIGPGTSKFSASGIMPARLKSPIVGFRPTLLLALLGDRMLPDVSLPIEPAEKAIDVRTPEPELEPLGVRLQLYALMTWPPRELYPLGMVRST